MPFEVKAADCRACTHGYCVSYIREQSRRMKDRDTQYRLAQIAAMACTFDNWVPGESACPFPDTTPLDEYLAQLIKNVRTAGAALQDLTPSPFGVAEKLFFLTEAQIGKVRGDIYETICRAILWNCCTRANIVSGPSGPQIAMLSLGDNYDLRKLFSPSSGKELTEFVAAIGSKGISLSYSTPDLVAIDISTLSAATQAHFKHRIVNLSVTSQDLMNRARELVAGQLRPDQVLFACGVKTSLRSDRMFQFLFEANAWKFIWRRVFRQSACPYHSITSRTFGADPERLRSVDFSGQGGPDAATRAIDSVTEVASASDIKIWFNRVLTTAMAARREESPAMG